MSELLVTYVARPVWLLDVDGVVNDTGRAGWHSPPKTGRVIAYGISHLLRWAPQLVAQIRSLLPVVDIRWSTSWIDVGTHDLETTVELPHLPHAYPADRSRLTPGRHFTQLHTVAKTQATLDIVASGAA